MTNPQDDVSKRHLKPQKLADTVLPQRVRSEQLFCNQHELIIEHQGVEYRLRITSNDKLILTK